MYPKRSIILAARNTNGADAEGEARSFRAIHVLDAPETDSKRAWVRFAVYVPDFTDRDALVMIDYPALVGAFSNELETRLQVGLQATWSKKGERIIPAGNGRTWIHTLNPTRYPAMNAEHIARIAYGERYEVATTEQRRNYRHRAGKAMNRLLAAGFAEVQRGTDGLPRYLPGKQWIGRNPNPK